MTSCWVSPTASSRQDFLRCRACTPVGPPKKWSFLLNLTKTTRVPTSGLLETSGNLGCIKAKGSEDKVFFNHLVEEKNFLAIPLGDDVLTIGMHYDLIGGGISWISQVHHVLMCPDQCSNILQRFTSWCQNMSNILPLSSPQNPKYINHPFILYHFVVAFKSSQDQTIQNHSETWAVWDNQLIFYSQLPTQALLYILNFLGSH